jgi:hypothetical protein
MAKSILDDLAATLDGVDTIAVSRPPRPAHRPLSAEAEALRQEIISKISEIRINSRQRLKTKEIMRQLREDHGIDVSDAYIFEIIASVKSRKRNTRTRLT